MQVFNALKKHRVFAAGTAVFTAVLVLILVPLSLLLMPKEFINTSYPSTSSILGFYKMPENTLDVLFLGSSHAISGFDTQELYRKYGLRSSTLGSGEQNVAVSYFYLKEALKTQKPKAVVLDTLMAFPFRDSKLLYSSASSSEKALNFMKPGINKLQAIYEISRYDEELDPVSMALPFLRYHDRWDSLDENDLMIWSDYASLTLHGYNIKMGQLKEDEADFKPFNEAEGSEAVLAPLIRSYLDRIEETCRENGMELLLVKTPSNKTGADEYLAMKAYAAEKGLRYIDFNEEGVYRESGFDFPHDMGNAGHANYYGAVKITDHIGDMLLSEGITAGSDDKKSWEDTEWLYERCKNNFFISVAETEEELKALTEDNNYSLKIESDKEGEKTVIYDEELRDKFDTVIITEKGEVIHD